MPVNDDNCHELTCCQANPFVGECCQPVPFDYSSQQFCNTQQSYTASCPDGLCGDPVTVTVPPNAFCSTDSQDDANEQALAAAQSLAESQLDCIDCNPGECTAQTYDTIQPTIEDATPSYFNSGASWPAGIYRITYVEGALKYNSAFGWGLNDSAAHRFTILYDDGASEVVGPSLDYQKFATQADLETHNSGQFVEFTHIGGKIGVYLEDFPYTDNVAGAPTPVFRLSKVCEPEPVFDCNGEEASVESLMRAIQERQVVISNTEYVWLERTNPGTEDPPLPLTPTPAYPPDGFFSGDSSDALRALQVQDISDVLDDDWLTFISPDGDWEGVDRVSVFYTTTSGNKGDDRIADTQLPGLTVTSDNWEESLQTLLDYVCQLQWIIVSNTEDDSTTELRETPAGTGADCALLRASVEAFWTSSTSWGPTGFSMLVTEDTQSNFTLSAYFTARRSQVQFLTNLLTGGVASSFWKLGNPGQAGHLDVAPVMVTDELFHQGSDAPPLDGTNFFSNLYGDVGDTISFEGDCPPFPSDPQVNVTVGWFLVDAVVQVFKSSNPDLGHWNYYP